MNTKKFQAEYYQAALFGHQIELQARVTTDNAHHYVRQRIDYNTGDKNHLWVDLGRAYTSEQKAHVEALFTHHLPQAKQAIDKWMSDHSFTVGDVTSYTLRLQPDGKAVEFRFTWRGY